jgi:hypothetical protein
MFLEDMEADDISVNVSLKLILINVNKTLLSRKITY